MKVLQSRCILKVSPPFPPSLPPPHFLLFPGVRAHLSAGTVAPLGAVGHGHGGHLSSGSQCHELPPLPTCPALQPWGKKYILFLSPTFIFHSSDAPGKALVL